MTEARLGASFVRANKWTHRRLYGWVEPASRDWRKAASCRLDTSSGHDVFFYLYSLFIVAGLVLTSVWLQSSYTVINRKKEV